MRTLLLIMLLSTTCISFAQSSLEILKTTYADQSIVVLNKVDSLVINSDKDIKLYHSITKQVLRPIHSDVLNTSISYDDFSPINSFKAEVSRLKEDGSLEVSDKVNKSYQNSMVSGIFYHDNKVINISYPFYSPGTTSKLFYEKKVTQPHFLNKFIFSEGYPTLASKYVVNCHKSVDLGYTLFNNPGDQLKFSKVDNGDYWLYTWEQKDIDSWDVYSYREVLETLPHLSIRIKSIEKNGKEVAYLKDMDAFYNWLYDFVDPLIEPNSEMDSLSALITAGISNDIHKLKAIYDWVQTNITYVAFEDGYNGFIPRKPNDVCHKKYGDCKDMALLLFTLLESAGIDASVVWIGTDDIPYKIEEILTPSAFNHMIACADIDGKRYWLDATAKYLDFEVTSPFTQGQEGLVAKSRDEYEIVTLPVTDIAKNQVVDSIQLSINEKQIVGQRTYTCSGYKKLDFIFDVYRFDEDRNEDISEYFTIGNDSYHQTNFNINKNDDQRKEAAVMTTDFTVDNYVRTFGQKVLINPLLLKFSNRMKFDTTLINYKNFEYNSRRTEHINLELGELNIQSLPESVLIENKLLKYSADYRVEDGHLLIQRVFEIKKYYLGENDALEWNEAMQLIKEQESDNLILIKS